MDNEDLEANEYICAWESLRNTASLTCGGSTKCPPDEARVHGPAVYAKTYNRRQLFVPKILRNSPLLTSLVPAVSAH
jgi:hypothetical protein